MARLSTSPKILIVLGCLCAGGTTLPPRGVAADEARTADAPSTAVELTLPQAIEIAFKQNVDITLAIKNIENFESFYWQAFSGALPHITLTGTYTRNIKKPVIFFGGESMTIGEDHSLEGTATAEQALYTGGKVHTALHAADKQRQAGYHLLKGTEDEVLFAVKRLFYACLLARDTVAIQQDNLNSAEDHLKTIRERFQQGLDSDLTLRRQEVDVAEAKVALIQAQNLYDVTLMSFQELLALDVDAPLRLNGKLATPDATSITYDSCVQKALRLRPELQAARKNTQIYEDLIDIAKSDYKPTLGLFATYDWTAQYQHWPPKDAEKASSIFGGLRLQHSLFSGGETWQRVRQARIQHERVKEEEARLERSVRVQVKREWLAVAEAIQRAQAEEAAVGQARMTLEATESRYRSGQSNQLELLDATVALNRTRTMFSKASHDFWVSQAALERAIGTPSNENPNTNRFREEEK